MCRAFAAKRLYRTAQGFNPGLRWLEKGALKVAPDVGRAGGMTNGLLKDAPRPPLTRNMVELPGRLARIFSCRDWSKLIAHLASGGLEAF